jgi:glycosyltransferase involved in cell wall biosynthesis
MAASPGVPILGRSKMHLVVNGKFTSQRVTGVQRVAYELLRAVQLVGAASGDIELVVPANAKEPGVSLGRRRTVPWLKGQLWEQVTLPIATRGELLISLCNSGPLVSRRQVVMVHDMAVYDTPHTFSRLFRAAYRIKLSALLRRAPTVLTVSSFSKSRICSLLDVDAVRVRVVRPGADHFARIESDASIIERLKLGTTKYCVIVGSLDPRKNLRRVLAAIERLGHLEHVKFVMAGGTNSRVFAASSAREPNERTAIVRAGYVSDGELKALYEHAACLVFPSLYEGFGLPPLEAMFCGCPAIVSGHPAIVEACGDAALYCDASSVDDIAEKIHSMMTDERLRQLYRTKGLHHARSCRWDEAARELMRILKGDVYEARTARGVHLPESALASRVSGHVE